jgi:hypothetical protein
MTTVMTDKDVSGLVKKAWGKALELTIDPVSGKSTSTAIRAFASAPCCYCRFNSADYICRFVCGNS